MVDFALTDEQKAIRDTARAFITDRVVPYEPEVLRRERRGEPGMTRDERRELQLAARKFGFWGLSTPEEYGGMSLPAVTRHWSGQNWAAASCRSRSAARPTTSSTTPMGSNAPRI